MTNYSLKQLFFLPASIVLLSGCTKDVTNIQLPETNPKLVVGCFISPQDTVLVVTLSRSNPVFGPDHNNANNLLVTDALVTISNGTNSAVIPYNNANKQYELQASAFPIAAGQTYYLTVSTPKGESVSASCTVPSSNLTSLTVDFIDSSSFSKKINVKWVDIPNQINYYRVFGKTITIDSFKDTVYSEMYGGDNSLQNDNDKDGKEMYSILEGYEEQKIISYDIYLMNIDLEYYKYYYSLGHYSSNDPFSEPNPIYTNIKGGLGVFAAYQKLYVRKI